MATCANRTNTLITRRSNRPFMLAALAGLACACGGTLAQTITVDSADDIVDIPWSGTIANLPGPNGKISLREAMIAADNTPGPQTVGFAIPQSLWHPFYPNRATVELDGPLSLNSNDTTIDCSTQTAFTGDTNPSGNEVGLVYFGPPNGAAFIYIFGNRNVVKALDGTGGNAFGASVHISGNDNRVIGCTTNSVHIDGNFGGPVATGNIIGGTGAGEGNVLSVVEIACWSDYNTVIGNRLTHCSIVGSQYCVYPTGNRIGGPTAAERNTISGNGYYGEEGFPTGTQMSVVWAKDTIIEGNYIGTTPDGMARQPQIGPTGVGVTDSINTIVRGNLIAGLRTAGGGHYQGQIFGDAIFVSAMNANNQNTIIEGNTIGLAADGVTVIPTRRGVTVSPGTARQATGNVAIGGPLPGQGNVISGVETYGILVGSLSDGVAISGNSIYDCGSLGIELTKSSGADGPTANDTGDGDAGANRLQNFPAISSAELTGVSLHMLGTFNSVPNETYTLEFFASPSCDSSGHGEGRYYLGAVEVDTNASGNAAFDLTLLGENAIVGGVVTVTATRASTLDTSEFSACATISAGSCPADFNHDGFVNGNDYDAFASLFDAGDLGADFNGDGFVNGNDYDEFAGAFDAGC
ncbi:MAG: hypothetical protein JNL50_14950 [Phycisphaerae bacterium]|nr:hypothetical protein [Phycisphaerae bacterium]